MGARIRPDLVFLAFLSIATNFGYYHFSNRDYFFPDSFTYMAPARSLLEGKGFTTDGMAETLRTPGYPLVIAGLHLILPGIRRVVLLQHLLNVLLVVAAYLFASARFGAAVARIAGFVLAVDPITIHYANKVLTENVFTVGLFAVTLMLLRLAARPSILLASVAGAVAGFLALVRPVAMLYFAAGALFIVLRGTRRRTAVVAAFLLPAAVLTAGWALRNRHDTGVLTVSSIGGANLLLHRAAGALAILDEGDFKTNLQAHQSEVKEIADEQIRDEYEAEPEELPHAVMTSVYGRVATKIILQHPLAYLELATRGVLVLLLDDDADAVTMVSRFPEESILRMTIAFYTTALALLAGIGLARLWRVDRDAAILMALTMAYFLIMSAGGEAEARFRVPLVPIEAICAGVGAMAMGRGVRERSAQT